jgi:hypothetical protein
MTDALHISNSSSLIIPKLRDDGTNWADYEPRARRAMGSKGLVAHLEGMAVKPISMMQVNGVYMKSLDTIATVEEIEARQDKIMDYEKREYLAQHLTLGAGKDNFANIILIIFKH